MASRESLQTVLVSVLGSNNVYFQPPATISMLYPAIVYERSGIANMYADNKIYGQNYSYTVTVIDADPDGEAAIRVSKLPKCKHDRTFKNDNLNHDVFTLSY